MTRAAGRNVATARLRAGRVTSIACRVRVEAGRNRHGDAAARRPVTGRATDVSHVHMPRVIELHAKAAQPRKGFDRAGLRVRVTDRADRTIRIRELLCVTTGAR